MGAKSAGGWDVKEVQCRNAPMGFLARANGVPCARDKGRAQATWGPWHAIGVARVRPEGAWHGPMARASVLGRLDYNKYGARGGKSRTGWVKLRASWAGWHEGALKN